MDGVIDWCRFEHFGLLQVICAFTAVIIWIKSPPYHSSLVFSQPHPQACRKPQI